MQVLYLKKEKDVITYGHGYDAYCFNLDLCSNLAYSVPQKNITKIKRIGNGVTLVKGNTYSEAPVTMTKNFAVDSNGIIFSDDREKFYLDWILTDDVTYLYRSGKRLDRKVVIPTMDKESYKKFIVSGDLKLELLTEEAFFKDTVTKTTTYEKPTAAEVICSITNVGAPCPFKFKMTFANGSSSLSIRLFENVDISILDYINEGSILEFDTETMIFKINDSERNLNISGSPFTLVPGVNLLHVRSVAAGDIEIQINERLP